MAPMDGEDDDGGVVDGGVGKRKYNDSIDANDGNDGNDGNDENENDDIGTMKRKRKLWTTRFEIEQARKEDIVVLLNSIINKRKVIESKMSNENGIQQGGGHGDHLTNTMDHHHHHHDNSTYNSTNNDRDHTHGGGTGPNDGHDAYELAAAAAASTDYDDDGIIAMMMKDDDVPAAGSASTSVNNFYNDIISPVLPYDITNFSLVEILNVDEDRKVPTLDFQHQQQQDGQIITDVQGGPTITIVSKPNPFKDLTSRLRSRAVLEFLLQPAAISITDFYTKYWEKRPLCIRSNSSDIYDIDDLRGKVRYDGIISETQIYNDIFEESVGNKLYYTRDVSVSKLEKNIETGVLEMKAVELEKEDGFEGEYNGENGELDDYYAALDSEEVWDEYKHDGCIVTIRSAVKYYPVLQSLVSLLELEFGCRVTAEVTLKPTSARPKTGDIQRRLLTDLYHFIPPKFDGSDCFKIQIEGFQRYIIFQPILGKSVPLSRTDGGQDVYDCTTDFLTGKSYKGYKVEPILDVTVRPGDVIYIPRGYVYQCYPLFLNEDNTAAAIRAANLDKMPHSLDITLSTMSKWSWIDLLEVLLPKAMQAASSNYTVPNLRQGLPLRFLEYMGTAQVPGALKKEMTPPPPPPPLPVPEPEPTPAIVPATTVEPIKHEDADDDDDTGNHGEDDDDDEDADDPDEVAVDGGGIPIDPITGEAIEPVVATAETKTTTDVVVMSPPAVYESYPVNDEEVALHNKRMQQLQNDFRTECRRCVHRVVKEAYDLIDAACDTMGVRFLTDRVPPALSLSEVAMTRKETQRRYVQPGSLVRLVRPGIARLTIEPTMEGGQVKGNNKAILYHCKDNALIYHETPLAPLEFEIDDAAAIEQLLSTLEPHWVCVNDLKHNLGIEEKVGVAQALFDEGILAIRN